MLKIKIICLKFILQRKNMFEIHTLFIFLSGILYYLDFISYFLSYIVIILHIYKNCV